MSIHPKLIYRFNEIPVKTPPSYFVVMDKRILKCIQTGRRCTANTILKEKTKSKDGWGPTLF